MADEVNENEEEKEEKEEESGGLGNLPPLSDFDSTADESSAGDLPPMDAADTSLDSPLSGLPPIDDINVDTPAVRASDLDTPTNREPIESPEFDTPTSDLDTPEPASGLGFQDFAADSDFSPETPEIGPGPDSDIETPMFDSAFGTESDTPMFDSAFSAADQSDTPLFDSGIATPGGGTPAPTQAMETPMFDEGGKSPVGGVGFDQDAFGAVAAGAPVPTGDEEIGTPIPDFSPDTEAPPALGTPGKLRIRPSVGGGIMTIGIAAGVGVIMLVAGLFLRPMVPFLPNPAAGELAAKDSELASLQKRLNEIMTVTPGKQLSEAELALLMAKFEDYNDRNSELQQSIASLDSRVQSARETLVTVEGDIVDKNGEFVVGEERLEDLTNDMAITQARHEGLIAENERLTGLVGELEEATIRQRATKDTLLHNLDLLIVQIEDGSPLTPEKYSHFDRLDKSVALRAKVARFNWVNPQLLNEYTDLYIDEMRIAASREYFFAKIPVHDSLGTPKMLWAECLMNGNWSVFFVSIDGKHVGSYENVSSSEVPVYEFREDLPSSIKKDIQAQIKAARVEDYKVKIQVLKEKQALFEDKSRYQRTYDSL